LSVSGEGISIWKLLYDFLEPRLKVYHIEVTKDVVVRLLKAARLYSPL
jgi:hypothetical protein